VQLEARCSARNEIWITMYGGINPNKIDLISSCYNLIYCSDHSYNRI